ncbi:Hypothetical protein SCF082_LOCUS24029, partial [Durusdinium trenchii]
QMYSNSTGVDKMSLERQLEGRARKVVKERTRNTMEERQTEMFRGMNEEDAPDFDRHWQERAVPHLPQHQVGFGRQLGDQSRARGGGGRAPAALSNGYPSPGGHTAGYGGYGPQRSVPVVQGTPVYPDTRPTWR